MKKPPIDLQVGASSDSKVKGKLSGKLSQLTPPPRLFPHPNGGANPQNLRRSNMRKNGWMTIGMTILASVIAVVACGPTRDVVVMEQLPKSVRKFNQCAETLSQSHYTEIGGSSKPTSAVKICQASLAEAHPALASDEVSATQSSSNYELQDSEVKYRIMNHKGGLKIKLQVHVEKPEFLSEKASSATDQILETCEDKISQLWKNSKTGVDFDLNFVDAAMEESKGLVNQHLTLIEISEAADSENKASDHPEVAMAAWPDDARFYPSGYRDADFKACAESYPKNDSSLVKCRQKAREMAKVANDHFCAQLSVMVAHWLGLSSEENEKMRCESTNKKDLAEKISSEAVASFMSAAKVLRAKGQVDLEERLSTFWSEARFSTSEMKTILAPACPDLKVAP